MKLTNEAQLQHDWIKEEDGSIDIFRFSAGFCNGPQCARCGVSYCHHCYEDCYREVCPAVKHA